MKTGARPSEDFNPPCPEALDMLLRRRSVTAKIMGLPGPTESQLSQIIQAGARVPDHGKLAPWRFLIFEGADRATFGNVLAAAFQKQEPDADAERVEFERRRFSRAPTIVSVISKPDKSSHIPEWEQILSSAAVCQNMLIAATAAGLGAQWLTEWYAYDDDVRAALNLQEVERVTGFIYLGSATETLTERARPDLDQLVERWRPSGRQ
jgi:nitroreductase